MGQSESSFKRTYDETVEQLSTVQLQEIQAKFTELYQQAGGSKGHVVDREAFSRYFNLPPTVGDRLFEAFDEKKNGKISFEEFACGLAIVLHGSLHDRCSLLFQVFNLAGDEGISRAELTTMLSAILQSTDTILYTVSESGGAVLGGEGQREAVRIMVDEAFKNCDITGTGKLLPVEFEYWLKRNPKVLDNLLSFNTKDDHCTLGELIMSPSEQQLGISQEVGVAPSEGGDSSIGAEELGRVTFTNPDDKESIEEIITDQPDDITDGAPTDNLEATPTENSSAVEQNHPPVPMNPLSEQTNHQITQTNSPKDETVPPNSPLLSAEYPGDNDRLASVWLASSQTEQLLSGGHVTTEHLTCPALQADIRMTDPIADLLSIHYPASPRKPLLTVDSVSMDVQGLRSLVMAGCYQSALELTSRFLSAHGQGTGQSGQPTLHTHKTLAMWSSRLSLMVYLGLYKEAESELEQFEELDNPDLYYRHHAHSYPGRRGSLVPFSMRLLHAVVPSLTGQAQLALDRLCRLKYTTTKILSRVKCGSLPGVEQLLSSQEKDAAVKLWTERLIGVIYFLGNALASLADYHTAAMVYQELLELCPQDAPHVYSGLGRLYLTLGDLQTGKEYFGKAEELCGANSCLVHMNRALVNVSLSKWQAARDCLQAALSLQPSNLAIKSNLTVCTFYLGRLKESIDAMKNLVTEAPPTSLQPAIFANLAAAYELESGQSAAKKLTFLPLLANHVSEGFQLQALNIR